MLKGLGFEKQSFELWLEESTKDNFVKGRQVDPYSLNISNLSRQLTCDCVKKFYIVKLSDRFQVRTWAMRK